MLGEVISGIAVPLFESFLSLGSRAGNWATTTLEIRKAAQHYHERYVERHGMLKLLGMSRPISLDTVYTPVKVLDQAGLQRFVSTEALEVAFRQSSNRSFQAQDRSQQPGLDVAIQEKYLMVLGGPGAGKSTFLRKMGLEALKGQEWIQQKRSKLVLGQQRRGLERLLPWVARLSLPNPKEVEILEESETQQCIPVFIELKRFSNTPIEIEQIIIEEFECCGFPEAQRFTSEALQKGKLLILLDGLDEVPSEKLLPIIQKIQDFVDKYYQNRFIASCRTAAYQSRFQRFTDVAMAEFEDQQIEEFIHHWFQSDLDQQTDTAKQCWELLRQTDYEAARDLGKTPLLLTLLCLVYDDSQSFPKNRASLYKAALDILLKNWTTEKRVTRDTIYRDLNPDLEIAMLSEIAYRGFQRNILFYEGSDIINSIKYFLETNLNAPMHLDGDKILQAIEIQQGVLVERAQGIYSFSHLTFQEYLTAQYISDHTDFETLVSNHLSDNRWREVFLLTSGLSRAGADELLLMMARKAINYLKTPKLQALIKWADQATSGSEGCYQPLSKRVVALDLALSHTRDRTLDLALALNLEYDLALARALALALAHDPALAHELQLETEHDLTLARARSHKLARDLDLAHELNLDLTVDLNYTIDREAKPDLTVDLNRAARYEKVKIFSSADFKFLISSLRNLKKTISKNRKSFESYEFCQAIFREIQKLWLQTLDLDPDMVRISPDDVTALVRYLEVQSLMIKCKDAAVRVSRHTWQQIEDQMLKVVNDSNLG